MSVFPDTGPGPGGSRNQQQWINAMGEDVALIRLQIRESCEEDASREERAKALGVAQKEANRLLSDIRRFARDIHGISQHDIDAQGPY